MEPRDNPITDNALHVLQHMVAEATPRILGTSRSVPNCIYIRVTWHVTLARQFKNDGVP
jgi:hypothetical protein